MVDKQLYEFIKIAMFFPFKEVIKNEMTYIHFEENNTIDIDENKIKDLLLTVFQLMYYNQGDKVKARLLYNEIDNSLTESSFYTFEINDKQKQFLDIIFNSEIPGLYDFDVSNHRLAEALKISTDFLILMDLSRNKLINNLKSISLLPENQKVYIE